MGAEDIGIEELVPAGHLEHLARWISTMPTLPEIDEPIPENAMRVGPGTDAVVWRICPSHEAEL